MYNNGPVDKVVLAYARKTPDRGWDIFGTYLMWFLNFSVSISMEKAAVENIFLCNSNGGCRINQLA